MSDFWDKYSEDLNEGYFKLINNEKCMKAEFIVEYPVQIAKLLKDYKRNKLSQIWRFYDHARKVQDTLHQKKKPLDARYAELCQLRPIVYNAVERNTVTVNFKKFIDLNINCIKNNEDLDAFIKHFQSVIAYLPRENQK